MALPCYCASGYLCPLHPRPSGSKTASTSTPLRQFAPVAAISTHNPSLTHPLQQQKHSLPTAPIPASKRLKTDPAPPIALFESLPPLKRVETARLAAATVPPLYRLNDEVETARRAQFAHDASDCWYFTAGVSSPDKPSKDEIGRIRAEDQARIARAPLDLKKPRERWLRCTECLKFDIWRVWKNNNNGGAAKPIRKHLLRDHGSAYMVACNRIGRVLDDKFRLDFSDEDISEPVTPEGILKYLTEWFAEDDIPFNVVSHRGFRRFFSYLGQGKATSKDIPDRRTVAAAAQKLSAEAKEKIIKEIKHARGRVSCTSDLWTDQAQRAFMSVTVHFVNRHRRFVHRLIAFRAIEGDHSGSHLAETFFDVLNEFGATHKLGLITLDNATNNDTLMAQLEEYMAGRGLDFDRHGNRLRCFPHVINLAVQDILSALTSSARVFREWTTQQNRSIDAQLEAYLLALESEPHNRTQRTVVALRHTQRRQGLRNTICEGNEDHTWRTHKLDDGVWKQVELQMKSLELILDCPTRWSSTRNMIERFLYLYPAVSRYIASNPALAQYAITHKDYEVLHDILTVLNLADQTQELLSSDKTPTLSLAIPLYHTLIDEWRRLQTKLPALSHAIGAGIKKLETYLTKTRSSPAHIVAMALNPSIGYNWIDQNWSLEEASNARLVVKSHMLRCLEEQQHQNAQNITQIKPVDQLAEKATKRINKGYSALLRAGMDARPVQVLPPWRSPSPLPNLSESSTAPFASPDLSASTREDHPQNPLPQPQRHTHELNRATVELEHQKFEDEPVIPTEAMNGVSPIDYWMAKSIDLPLIHKVAMDILPVQASSVSSERVFSSSKMTCTQFRTRISVSNVEALQILKHSLRGRLDTTFSDGAETLDLMAHHLDDLCGDAAVLTVD